MGLYLAPERVSQPFPDLEYRQYVGVLRVSAQSWTAREFLEKALAAEFVLWGSLRGREAPSGAGLPAVSLLAGHPAWTQSPREGSGTALRGSCPGGREESRGEAREGLTQRLPVPSPDCSPAAD